MEPLTDREILLYTNQIIRTLKDRFDKTPEAGEPLRKAARMFDDASVLALGGPDRNPHLYGMREQVSDGLNKPPQGGE